MSKFTGLRTILDKEGWSISSVELASDCWWAKEIWALQSNWSPVGKIIYLIFLIDPESSHDPNNPQESVVWAVGASLSIPTSRPVGDIAVVPVQRDYHKRMPEIVELAAAMRMTE